MKMINKICICFVASFCMIFSGIHVYAEKTDTTPYVTFTNSENENPDLYVSKNVVGDEGYDVSHISFMFELLLDGIPASNREYLVFDASGNEVPNIYQGVKIPYQTDRNGRFSLKDGQIAKFEYVGTGKRYEVKEMAMEGFIQISPAPGTHASGNITSKGTRVDFINKYVPEEKNDTASITVSKCISYPEGYEIPNDDTYMFELKLKNKLYSNQPYILMDGTKKMTDDRGRFLLKANETAVFTDIETNIDYQITEIIDENADYRVIGEGTLNGAVYAPSTPIYFTNSIASFGVKKKIVNGDSEEEFKFLLLKEDKKVFANAKYYLYDKDLHLIRNCETDSHGYFTLKNNETAIFYGIDKGTVYHVQEIVKGGFKQITPTNSDGFENNVVKDNVEIHVFENEMINSDGELRVIKTIENAKEDAPLENMNFTFVLSKLEGSQYKPVSDAIYEVQTETGTATFYTDKNGKFQVHGNQMVCFKRLKLNETYRVEEIDIPSEYSTAQKVYEGLLINESLEFTFTNVYTAKKFNIHLTKKDYNDQALSGAVFALYLDDKEITLIDQYTSDIHGNIAVLELKPGTYYLKEIKAPEGYELLVDMIKLDIRQDSGEYKIYVNDKLCQEDGEQIKVEYGKGNENDSIILTVYNNKSFFIPLTGGAGIGLFIGVGLLGMGTVFYMIKRVKQDE